jgi:hypothetical protein
MIFFINVGRKSTHVVFLARERNRAFARIVRRETAHSLGLGVAGQDQSTGTALVTVADYINSTGACS